MMLAALSFASCKKDSTEPDEPMLNIKLNFDPNQARLNNLGLPATMPAGNAGQVPDFRGLGLHMIELLETPFTPWQGGEIVYMGAETTAGGANAIDFSQEIIKNSNEVYLSIPLADIANKTYNSLRVSVAYQNYDIKYNIVNISIPGVPSSLLNQNGTISSFLGYNTYIESVTPRELSATVNDDKVQGFWAFETDFQAPLSAFNSVQTGGSAGATTVVDPNAAANGIPANTCIVFGGFNTPMTITGNESSDIDLTLSFSINDSFEWQDLNGNGELDLDLSNNTLEPIVDMGLRGLEVIVD